MKMERERHEHFNDILETIENAPDQEQFIDLDIGAPQPVQLSAEPWVNYLTDAKDEFDGAIAVFSTWRVEVDGTRAGRMVLTHV